MKTLAICGLVALTLILGYAASAQDPKQPRPTDESPVARPYAVPPEHKAFVDDFKKLLEKYPEAAQRYKLADMGNEPMPKKVFVWKCENVGLFEVDCKPEPIE